MIWKHMKPFMKKKEWLPRAELKGQKQSFKPDSQALKSNEVGLAGFQIYLDQWLNFTSIFSLFKRECL